MSGYLHTLLAIAADEAGCTIQQMLKNTRRYAPHRMKAMKIAYEAGFSSEQIGRVFNRDHSTVLYAAGRLRKYPRTKSYPQLKLRDCDHADAIQSAP